MLNSQPRSQIVNLPNATKCRRQGFTLVELLVVVAVTMVLAGISAAAVRVATNQDRVRAGARQIQSYLLGARDRAIYAKAPRGVRFLLDSANNRTVSSLVFIQQTPPWTQGTIALQRADSNADGVWDKWYLQGFDNNSSDPRSSSPTNWYDLFDRGLLVEGGKVKLRISGKEIVCTVRDVNLVTSTSPQLKLTSDPNVTPPNTTSTLIANVDSYELELAASLLPNADPVLLPKGAVVHLDRCTSAANVDANPSLRADKLPSGWRFFPSAVQSFNGVADPSGFDYDQKKLDVMFSARGVVTGSAAQKGILHFYIAEAKDADRDRRVYWPSSGLSAPEYGSLNSFNAANTDIHERGNKNIVTLFTRTGSVSTYNVQSNTDPFKFAETGEVAGK